MKCRLWETADGISYSASISGNERFYRIVCLVERTGGSAPPNPPDCRIPGMGMKGKKIDFSERGGMI